MTEKMLCLRCGHEWVPYKADAEWKRCPNGNCRSYSVIEASLFHELVNEILEECNPHEKRFFPILDNVIRIIKRRGLNFRPLQTLELARAIEARVIQTLENQ